MCICVCASRKTIKITVWEIQTVNVIFVLRRVKREWNAACSFVYRGLTSEVATDIFIHFECDVICNGSVGFESLIFATLSWPSHIVYTTDTLASIEFSPKKSIVNFVRFYWCANDGIIHPLRSST